MSYSISFLSIASRYGRSPAEMQAPVRERDRERESEWKRERKRERERERASVLAQEPVRRYFRSIRSLPAALPTAAARKRHWEALLGGGGGEDGGTLPLPWWRRPLAAVPTNPPANLHCSRLVLAATWLAFALSYLPRHRPFSYSDTPPTPPRSHCLRNKLITKSTPKVNS